MQLLVESGSDLVTSVVAVWRSFNAGSSESVQAGGRLQLRSEECRNVWGCRMGELSYSCCLKIVEGLIAGCWHSALRLLEHLFVILRCSVCFDQTTTTIDRNGNGQEFCSNVHESNIRKTASWLKHYQSWPNYTAPGFMIFVSTNACATENATRLYIHVQINGLGRRNTAT